MEMREIDQLLMHDSAVQLFIDAVGEWHEFGEHIEESFVNEDTRHWLQRVNPYVFELPEFLGLKRTYRAVHPRRSVIAFGKVVAPNMLELRIDYPTDDGEGEWSQNVTYCGAFTVWWK